MPQLQIMPQTQIFVESKKSRLMSVLHGFAGFRQTSGGVTGVHGRAPAQRPWRGGF